MSSDTLRPRASSRAARRVPSPAAGKGMQRPASVAQSDDGLPMPHERDQGHGHTASLPNPVIEQASKNLQAGLVDTDMRATPGLDAARRARLVGGAAAVPQAPPPRAKESQMRITALLLGACVSIAAPVAWADGAAPPTQLLKSAYDPLAPGLLPEEWMHKWCRRDHEPLPQPVQQAFCLMTGGSVEWAEAAPGRFHAD